MTIQQLRYITKIVECGSITEAARQLYVSQPSLSAAVKEIENEYHIEIFHRTSRGITLSSDGSEFLSYARQVIEQADLLEGHYNREKQSKQLCAISTQHYAFSVNAFVNLITSQPSDEYEYTLRETRTYEILEDVSNYRSELGILFFSSFNEKILRKMLKEKHLVFTPLFDAEPHVFISSKHPLAKKKLILLEELEEYPCLAFEQGTYNSFYFSEEILSTLPHKKTVHVSDRATLFNLLLGINGYTICTGVLNSDLNGDSIISVRLKTEEEMRIGYITNEKLPLSHSALHYIEELKALIANNGYTLLS